jgi:hypothetical protein
MPPQPAPAKDAGGRQGAVIVAALGAGEYAWDMCGV